jgi:hypothetical protein
MFRAWAGRNVHPSQARLWRQCLARQRTRRNPGIRFTGRSGGQRLCRPDQNERHNADRGEEQQF